MEKLMKIFWIAGFFLPAIISTVLKGLLISEGLLLSSMLMNNQGLFAITKYFFYSPDRN